MIRTADRMGHITEEDSFQNNLLEKIYGSVAGRMLIRPPVSYTHLIGAVLQKDDTGGAKIIQLYEGGPGEQAGLKKGDVIKAVDGADVTDKETSDIAAMVRDSEKDSVMLTIQRENEEKTRDVKVEIRDVEIQTVSHEMLSEDTGYIRISEFSEVTSDQYKNCLLYTSRCV